MTHILSKGANVGLSQVGLNGPILVTLTWDTTPGLDADLSAFITDDSGKVRSDSDFIFFNEPVGAGGAIRHVGKSTRGGLTVDQIMITPADLPSGVSKVVVGASLDGAGTFTNLPGLGVEVTATANSPAAITYTVGDLTTETAVVFVEVYVRPNGEWKVRAVGQGYDTGLAGLATDHGVSVDDEPAPPTVHTPAPPVAPLSGAAPVSLAKQRVLSLEKTLATSDPQMLSLVKQAGVSLTRWGIGEHTARVALVIDISASMRPLFDAGAVQRLAERVLALGLRFDDDGVVDVFLFGEQCTQPSKGLTHANYRQYIANLTRTHPLEYETRYATAVTTIRRHYYGKSGDRTEARPDTSPVYVLFLTDGSPNDASQTTRQIRSASYEPIFWQFVGIGGSGKDTDFPYLERLDDLDRRFIDNAGFFQVTRNELLGANPISDDTLFERMMREYPVYLRKAATHGLVV